MATSLLFYNKKKLMVYTHTHTHTHAHQEREGVVCFGFGLVLDGRFGRRDVFCIKIFTKAFRFMIFVCGFFMILFWFNRIDGGRRRLFCFVVFGSVLDVVGMVCSL